MTNEKTNVAYVHLEEVMDWSLVDLGEKPFYLFQLKQDNRPLYTGVLARSRVPEIKENIARLLEENGISGCLCVRGGIDLEGPDTVRERYGEVTPSLPRMETELEKMRYAVKDCTRARGTTKEDFDRLRGKLGLEPLNEFGSYSRHI